MSRLVIESGRTEAIYWRDLWRYRELFYVLAWRDIAVRYKQTAVGIIWSLVPPFLSMVVMTVIFGKLAKMPSDDVPYPLFSFAGLLPWQFFSNALAASSQSVVSNSNLISKVYFPRLIIPASTVVTSFVDFLISFFLMAAAMIWYRFCPSWHVVFLPLLIVLAFATVLGPGLIITSLNVRFRDFRFILPLVTSYGLFICPVAFSSSDFIARIQTWQPHHHLLSHLKPLGAVLYYMNPMVSVIDGFRWSLLGGNSHLYLPGFFLSGLMSFLFLGLGIWYFRRVERTFADII